MPYIQLTPQTNEAYFNAIIANDPFLNSMYPDVAALDYASTCNSILENSEMLNAFISTMVNKIGETIIRDAMISNPLAMFKGGILPFGKKIEDIFVEAATEHWFNQEEQENEWFKREIPDVSVIYHVENRKSFFKVTISRDEMRGAMFNEYGLNDLEGKIVNSLYKGDYISDFKYMKTLLNVYAENGFYYPVAVPKLTDDNSAKAIIKKVREFVGLMQMPSNKYNSLNRTQQYDKSDLVIFMTPATEATIDVDVLAVAFHMDKAEFLSKVVLIDEMPKNTSMILTSKQFIVQRDTVFYTDVDKIGGGRYFNVQLNHDGIYSTCRFQNAIAFVETVPSVTGVTIDGGDISMDKGTAKQFNATVTGTENVYVPKAVEWSITGNTSKDTYINCVGLLVVSSLEKAESITITAKSIFDETKTATATITFN